eukprot:m.9099 g.9099  ORF g.9099 m.9099 type:complete len:183 (-) comp2364_c0_seq1:76-624(-)
MQASVEATKDAAQVGSANPHGTARIRLPQIVQAVQAASTATETAVSAPQIAPSASGVTAPSAFQTAPAATIARSTPAKATNLSESLEGLSKIMSKLRANRRARLCNANARGNRHFIPVCLEDSGKEAIVPAGFPKTMDELLSMSSAALTTMEKAYNLAQECPLPARTSLATRRRRFLDFITD